MKILVLCGDRSHSPAIARQGLAALSSAGFTFEFLESTRDWHAEALQEIPVVVLTKSDNVSATEATGWMTESVQLAFQDYVRRGHGLLAIHSGTAEYESKPVLRSLLGGVFTHHPAQCPVTVTPLAGHPLAVGSTPFTLTDEHYFMAMDDPHADVFVTTSSIHGEQPGGWTRAEGDGRVVVLTPGHNLEVWQHFSFQVLLYNSLRWCSRVI